MTCSPARACPASRFPCRSFSASTSPVKSRPSVAEVEGISVGQRVLVDPIDRVDGGLARRDLRWRARRTGARSGTHDHSAPRRCRLCRCCSPAGRLWDGLSHDDRRGRAIRAGEKVLILGASGGVGTCCVQLAKQAGATVIACASSDEKLERLKALGADLGLNYMTTDWVAECRSRFGRAGCSRKDEGGIDVVVNFTGGETWVPSLRVMRRDGRLLTCGATAGYDPREDIRLIWTFELNIIGSNGWSRDDVLALLDLVRNGKLEPALHPATLHHRKGRRRPCDCWMTGRSMARSSSSHRAWARSKYYSASIFPRSTNIIWLSLVLFSSVSRKVNPHFSL